MNDIEYSGNVVHFQNCQQHRMGRPLDINLNKIVAGQSVGREFQDVYWVRVEFSDGREAIDVNGRKAWALRILYEAGEKGIWPHDFPAPRWSNYVFGLRQMGLRIETLPMKQTESSTFTLTRYILREDVKVHPNIPSS